MAGVVEPHIRQIPRLLIRAGELAVSVPLRGGCRGAPSELVRPLETLPAVPCHVGDQRLRA